MEKEYELIEHTADIGIRVQAGDLKELFSNSASAMFDLMAQIKKNIKDKKLESKDIIIKQKAGDLEELFINWLNELLSLSATRELVFNKFKIVELGENKLKAKVSGCDIKNYKINTEIKAATYHELKLEKTKSGRQVEVIFDV